MAQNDKAVITAAVGYVFVANPGTPKPTPAQLTALDPETFGAQVQTLTVTADGGQFTAKNASTDTPVSIDFDATPAEVQVALESLASIGEGNIHVDEAGTLAGGLDVTFIGALQGTALAPLTLATSALTGATKTATAVVKTAPNGWKNIGHTSRNDMPEFGFDGGDSEIRGSWQNAKLRELITEQAADYLTMFLHQFDTDSFELYYGPDAAVNEPGVFGVDGEQHVNERAFLVIVKDGSEKVGFYAAKASVRRDDAIQMPVDDLASLPVRATFLKMPGRRLFDWISEKLFR
ncbi:Uncharacterised protein [Mycobacteroides abscessus subsp. abscessus]|uniref:phage tail tube protein n=1 Tax=Mycobacteroides abscessus TaxID=36809 RepID=UPI000928EFB5|nr:hypothetical protein [Mycobacteroides abscessus]SHS97967.1 Uncharacterised protein [Mycobacteroides abscessus subsp. abscessus]SLK65047.1 Uncharacterised protein [Mycobacteroides abscessus subsp. abscessus]